MCPGTTLWLKLTDTRSHLEDWRLLARHKAPLICGETWSLYHVVNKSTTNGRVVKGERSERNERNSIPSAMVLHFAAAQPACHAQACDAGPLGPLATWKV